MPVAERPVEKAVAPPRSQLRCHRAKSAYCTRSSGSGDGSPAWKASYNAASSFAATPNDQPSVTMWCIERSRALSFSPSRISTARTSGPAARSNGRARRCLDRQTALEPRLAVFARGQAGTKSISSTESVENGSARRSICCTGRPSTRLRTTCGGSHADARSRRTLAQARPRRARLERAPRRRR